MRFDIRCLTGASTLAQLTRFSAVGLLSSALYAAAFVGLSPAFGNLVSNVVAMVVSTLSANELHRRLTFQASAEVGWFHAQLQGGGLAVVGLVASSLALMALDAVIPSAGWWVQLLMLGAISGGIGLIRFVALRAWVFPAGPRRMVPSAAAAGVRVGQLAIS